MLTKEMKTVLAQLRDVRRRKRPYADCMVKNLSREAGLELNDFWPLMDQLSALELAKFITGGAEQAEIEITNLGMHQLDPTNPLYDGNGSLEHVPGRERLIMEALFAHWPEEPPMSVLEEETGFNRKDFDAAYWELSYHTGYLKSLAVGRQSEVRITKKGLALFEPTSPVFKDVRDPHGDQVNVYGDMNQSAAVAGKGSATVNIQNVNRDSEMEGLNMEDLLTEFEWDALLYAYQKQLIRDNTPVADLQTQLKMSNGEALEACKGLNEKELISASHPLYFEITRKGMKLCEEIKRKQAAHPPAQQIAQQFNVNKVDGPLVGEQSGGQTTGSVSAENVAIGDGATINITYDQRVFMEEFERQINERDDIKPEDKQGIIKKAWEFFNSSPVTWDIIKVTLATLAAA